MRELLKTDLRRIVKDKLFLVTCILGVFFALSTPLLYKGLSLALDMEEDMIGLFASAKSIFFTSFSPSGNFGIILPILLAIVLCKDFSYGTIRNKIICGKSRTKIFLSTFLSGTIVICGTMLVHALLTLGVSLCFFQYQAEDFTGKTFLYVLLSILLSVLIYVFISAIVALLSVSMKNAGLAVVLYFAVNFFFSIVGTIVAVASAFLDTSNEFLVKLFEILQKANIFTTTHIGTGSTYGATDILSLLIPICLGTVACIFLGISIFRKKDIK